MTSVRSWEIYVHDSGDGVYAMIENIQTGKILLINQIPYGDDAGCNRDEAIADLFAGPLPNIRDSFDTV